MWQTGVLVALFVVLHPTLQREVHRFSRQPGPGGPGGPGGPMGPGPMPRPPPPVDPNFVGDCEMQRNTMCEPDGSFSAIQCMGPRCFCVNTETGEKINAQTFSMREMETFDCSSASSCPTTECGRICPDGYRLDERQCQLCECNAPLPPERCSTVKELVREGGCSCSCVMETPQPSPGGGPRTRMMAAQACPSCNNTCAESVLTEEDLSCAVVNGEDCEEGTTLRSVGRHGRTQCVQDLAENDECAPDSGPASRGPRSGPSPSGVDKRKTAGKVGSAPPPCQVGLVCKEARFREYVCTTEEPNTPCVMARASDPSLQCDPEGLFKPVQCRPAPVDITTDSTTANPVTVAAGTTFLPTTFLPTTPPPATAIPGTTQPSLPTSSRRRKRMTGGDHTPSRHEEEPQLCRCVEPDGDPVEGSEVRVQGRLRGPLCEDMFMECRVPGVDGPGVGGPGPRGRGPGHFHVAHGEDYFDAANCRTCECKDGNATALCSAPGNCTSVPVERKGANCTLEGGVVIPHDGTLMVSCETCGCRNGRVRCTKKIRGCSRSVGRRDRTPRPTVSSTGSTPGSTPPSFDEPLDPCDQCRARPPGPTCGPDGRNHMSHCMAVQCAGISPVELQEGPCQSQDACEEHPCRGGMVCINRKGSIACLGRRGCSARHLRTCVDVERLNCPVVEESETTPTTSADFDPESTAICGSDGETYQSLCHLIQTSSNVRVAHAGECTNPECQTGQVCGSDGVTYSNPCELESQASVRVDYPGACVTSSSSLEELCEQVMSEGRCTATEGNCDSLVFPEDGCCPVCGGSVQIVVDIDAITDASDTNPDLQVVDSFTVQLLTVEELVNISDRCTVEVGLTSVGHLQIVFKSLLEDAEFCFDASKRVEAYINGGIESIPEDGVSTVEPIVLSQALPQAYAYAMAASAAEPVNEVVDVQATTVGEGTNGSKGLHQVCILVMVLIGFVTWALY